MKATILGIGLFFIFGAPGRAQAEKIYLDPGSEVMVYDAPTTVVCSQGAAFLRYCRCRPGKSEGRWILELVLERNGSTDILANYPAQEICEDRMEHNPACHR